MVTGVTANDSGDSDTGANNLMNYPTITKIEYLGTGKYKVYGNIDNTAAGESPFTIEVCESELTVSGHGDCVQSLGTTTANSPWNVEVTVSGSNGADGRVFSTLATNALGSTSEFSSNFVANSSNPNYTIIIPPEAPSTPVYHLVLTADVQGDRR